MKKLYWFLLFFTSILSSQNDREIMYGVITNDSLTIDNVNVVNKTTNKGTVSNKIGRFQILVKESDIIQFSNIQYLTKKIIINKNHIQKKAIIIHLNQKTNELQEVILENMAKDLGLPNADKEPLNKLERNLNAYSQAPTPIVILATLLGQQGGIDDIYNIISGNRKRDIKLKHLLEVDKKNEIIQEYIISIRNHFHDNFFINTLEISKGNINAFLNYCLPKDILFLFDNKRYLDLIDIFITESKAFKNN